MCVCVCVCVCMELTPSPWGVLFNPRSGLPDGCPEKHSHTAAHHPVVLQCSPGRVSHHRLRNRAGETTRNI